jgi:hypothetical protein
MVPAAAASIGVTGADRAAQDGPASDLPARRGGRP